MRIAWLLLALAACKSGGGDDYQVLPGGDDVVVTPMIDAPKSPTDGTAGDGPMLSARVCLLADLRTPNLCAGVGADGLTVRLGTSTATTAADGSFSLPTPSATNLVWRVTGTDLAPSELVFSTSTVIPAISAQYYEDLKGSTGIIIGNDQGSIVLFVTAGGAPLENAQITVNSPAISGPPLGDTSARLNWNEGTTGPAGVAWIPNVSTGSVTMIISAPQQAGQMLTLPLDDQAISFGTVAFP